VKFPMQELELNYPTTKGKVYNEEEDRYLLCRLNYYTLKCEDVYDRIKKDVTEFPVFRFDWFFKSRTAQELQRRCNTLLSLIEKEAEGEGIGATNGNGVVDEPAPKKGPRGKKRGAEDGVKSEKPSRAATPNVPAGGSGSAAKRPSKKKKV